jgi:predicted MPP superfamily phosphohydrolase
LTFFLIVTLVYFFMHALVWGRMSRQLGLNRRATLVGLLVAAFLTITPFLAHLIPETWPQPPVRAAWWLVYLWMGIIFYLFWLQLAGLLLELAARLVPAPWTVWLPRGRKQLSLIALITVLTVGYGLYATTQWNVPKIVIESPHISRDIRVVLVSDTHFGVMTRQPRVERLVAFIQGFEPDLVIFAGDQINDHPGWLKPKALAVAKLDPPLGAFGVLGNHEFYIGLKPSQIFHDLAEIRLLRNETLILPKTGIQLVGIDDPAWVFKDHGFITRELAKLAPELLPEHFQILVTHRPWGWEEKAVPLGIELHVAAHTHGGQIFPFNWLVRLYYKYVAGHFERDGSHLFVTTGTFGWGPPLRVGTRPEVAVIDLIKLERQQER